MSETPGNKALEVMKSMEKTISEFKKPNVPQKKCKPKILTEEKYIEELSKIIQRDFFPDLEKLRAQNEYLEALDKNDYVRLRELYAKYSGKKASDFQRELSPPTFETPIISAKDTPQMNRPENNDTPASTSNESTVSNKSKSISDGHSLDSFLHRYTSEDNYSFEEIIETANEKLRQKFAVLYNEEQLSADQLTKALTLPSIEKQFEEPDPLRKIETWTYKNNNYIMYIPDGVDLTDKEKIEKANHRQLISHSNTRLNVNPFNESQNIEAISTISKNQSKNLSGKIGVDGNIVDNTKSGQFRGFDLVKTPSPRPGEAFSPIMTWGEIEGTPFRLDGGDTPLRSNSGPSFRINENSRRDAIGLQLAEKVGEKMRAQKQRAMNTARKNMSSPFIRSSMERLASMSPAARRLATSKLGLRSPTISPSPYRSSKSAKSSVKSVVIPTATQKTPTLRTPKQISSTSCDLTDNLLKIPSKRMKADDFF